jgi:hypothetical protein
MCNENLKLHKIIFLHQIKKNRYTSWGARWPAISAAVPIAEAKQCSQRSVIGWVTKMYYLELLRASEGTLSRWSRLHLQSLAPTPVSRGVDVRQAAGRKTNYRIFITTWWKNMLHRPHLVWEKGRKKKIRLMFRFVFILMNIIII